MHGSMFGGKTEYMIAELSRASAEGKRVCAFKHVIDDRYEDLNHLVTHRNERFDAIRVPDAPAIMKHVIPEGRALYDLIAIDEGQFFRHALIDVAQVLREQGVSVLIAGITHDAWGRLFDPMPQLAAMADHVVLKQAPCRVCGQTSPYTQRLSSLNALHMVGGIGDYEPRCAEHFTPLPGPPEAR